MKGRPLRLKITLWGVTIGALALLVFGVVFGISLQRAILPELDRELQRQADGFFARHSNNPASIQWSDDASVRAAFPDSHRLLGVRIDDNNGVLLYTSKGVAKETPWPGGDLNKPFTGEFAGKRARILSVERDTLRLLLATDFGPFEKVERAAWMTFAILVPVTLLIIVVGCLWLARRIFQPVEELTSAAERISAERSGQRLPLPETRDEIFHLTTVLNAMVDRIQRSYVQARRFSADASHELKTPLTIIRGELEVALGAADMPPAVEKMMVNLQEETNRLIHIVEGLLLLSQADAGKFQLDLHPVDFTAMLQELIEDVEILAAPKSIRVQADLSTAATVAGEPQFLRQVLLNLFDNAIKYNVPNGEIHTTLEVRDERVIFTISNSGAQIPRLERERVFDRFHRADSGRDRTRGGQGLGLSICREIARAHHGEITLVPTHTGWTMFQFSMPAVTQAPGGKSLEPARPPEG
jgi:signal transduction histidine kinase